MQSCIPVVGCIHSYSAHCHVCFNFCRAVGTEHSPLPNTPQCLQQQADFCPGLQPSQKFTGNTPYLMYPQELIAGIENNSVDEVAARMKYIQSMGRGSDVLLE